MIIMMILIALSITLLALYIGLFRDNLGCSILTTVVVFYTVATGISCALIHNSKNRIENTKFELDYEYEFLSVHKDSAIYFERINDYNAKVINNKKLLHSVWTNWFISPAYDDAKLIGEENENSNDC